jgi:hypothetical protein
MLKFSEANAKTVNLMSVPQIAKYFAGGNKAYSFDLPAGWSCPFAKQCMAKIHVSDGKRFLKDGPHSTFRCFSASQEVVYTNTFLSRQHNFNTLKRLHLNDMIRELDRSIPQNCGVCRIHVSGDFFSPEYMFAWIEIARKYKYVLFYAYTKSLTYWLRYRKYINNLPNFVLTASYGGYQDKLIRKHKLRFAKVVHTVDDAGNLPIDHDDSHAATAGGNFALLLHGVQPKGSVASTALQLLKGKGSYARV